jgi:membrane protease YdiL (CAAX protease family)
VALPLWGDSPLVAGLLTFGAVLALGRSTLPWLGTSNAGKIARRLIRVGVFFAPLPFAPGLDWSAPLVAVAAGAVVGLVLLVPDGRILRRSLHPGFHAMMPRQNGVDATRDLIVAGGSGIAQEYLYRGLLLLGLAQLIGWWALPVSAALFVLEHLVQGLGGHHYDPRDIAAQVALSLGLGALALLTGSILPAVIGHTVYNLPGVIQVIVRAIAHRSDRSLHHVPGAEHA